MKKNIITAVSILMLCSFTVYAQTMDWVWAKSGSGIDSEGQGRVVAADANGNVYITGKTGSSGTSFETITLTSAGSNDVFIAKYSPDGNLVWARSDGGTGADGGNGIAVDANGNIYVTGIYSKSGAIFGTTELTSAGGNDIFIAKYDKDGNLLWVKNGGGTGADVAYNVAVDANNNVYVTGYFSGTAGFGSVELTSTGSTEAFLIKYDSDGNVIWGKSAGGSSSETAIGVSVDLTGNIYMTGYFMGTESPFGPDTLSSAGATDVFLAKYDTDGNIVWAKSAGGSGSDFGYFVTTDMSGKIYVVGNIGSGGALFNAIPVTSAGGNDIFIAKFDSDGQLIWVKTAGGTGSDNGYGVAVSKSNIYVTGYFNDEAAFGSTKLTTLGGNEIFVAKYDSDGEVKWARSAGGTDNDEGWGIYVDENEQIYLTGRYRGVSTSFGSINLTNADQAGSTYEVFLARLGDLTPVDGETRVIPGEYSLSQNYPNPFNPATSIKFELPRQANVTIKVFDILGKEIATLVNEEMHAGTHSVYFDAAGLSSGVYFYSLVADNFTAVRKMLVMK